MFEAADGKQARWRYAYDLVLSKNPGEDITDLELSELIGTDDPQILLSTMRDAVARLERDKKQTVKRVRHFGWIVQSASGNLDLIEARRRKAYRATDRTARLIVATDRAELSPIERSRLDFESRNVLAARSLYSRKTRSFAELEADSRAGRSEDRTSASPGSQANRGSR